MEFYRIQQHPIEQVLQKLNSLTQQPAERHLPRIIAIDGRCASGKSTFAKQLSKRTSASVIHMDDFFLPIELRTGERLNRPGGNFHYERFQKEVLEKLSLGKDFTYQRFDCSKMALGDHCPIRVAELYLVEGAYSCHPLLGDYMDLKVFFHVESGVQLERIAKRGGEEALRNFKEQWIPLEEAYFRACRIREQAHMVIDTTCYF